MSGTPGSAIGFFLMEHWKMVANCHRAMSWSSLIDMTELVGCGLVSAVMRSFAAYMAASCDDTLGINSGLERTPLYHKFVCPVFLECRFDNIYSVWVPPPHTTHVVHVEPMFHAG